MDKSGLPPVSGLRNLGNTCYYNSMMQCLMHTHLMKNYLEAVGVQDGWTAPRRNNFTMAEMDPFTLPKRRFDYNSSIFRGFVYKNLQQLFAEFRMGISIEPGTLLQSIRDSYNRPVLPHYTQCDANEAFMLLTEALEIEERKLRKTVVKKHEFAHFKKLPIEDAKLAYQKVADSANLPTYIDAVFGLVYLQFIKCEDKTCNHISTRLTTSRHLLLNLCFLNQTKSLASDQNGKRMMTKYKQKKLLEKRKRENRRTRKNTGSSHSTSSQIEPEEVEHEKEEKYEHCELLGGNDEAHGIDLNGNEVENDTGLRNLQATIGKYVKNTQAPHILDCLANWAAENDLYEYQCDNCCPEKSKKRVDATQRFLLFAPPPVLVLCLERVSMHNRKVSTQVKFDLVLDIGPFCVNYGLRFSHQQKELKYGLYGIVIHEGSGSNYGHYIACVRRRKPPTNIDQRFKEAFSGGSADQETLKKRMQELMEETRQENDRVEDEEPSEDDLWYSISDSYYHPVSWATVCSKQAFMLFYERLD